MQRALRPRIPFHDIYQYLIQKNFNLSSDKILKDPQGNADIIWNILVFLTTNLKDTKYDQTQPTLMYLIDPQLHKHSIKKIREYIAVSDTFKKILKINQEYPIKQILKPEREIIHERISILIQANKYIDRVSREYEGIRTQMKLKKQLVYELKKKLDTKLEEIEQIKLIKQKQKLQYQEKLVSIQNISKQITYKKKQKLDLLDNQQSLDNQLKKKIKNINQLNYHNQDLKIKIKQLERQVIRNAPKLKKQRYQLIQSFDQLLKNNKIQFEIWKNKIYILHHKLRPFYGLKQKSKTFKIQAIKRQIDRNEQQLNILNDTIIKDQQIKHSTINSKKEIRKNIQQIEKDKKQIQQTTGQEQRQLKLLKKSQYLLLEEQKKHKSNIKILQQKNYQSINQYKLLQDKIKHRSDKFKQRIFQIMMRLKDVENTAKNVIQDTFSEFN